MSDKLKKLIVKIIDKKKGLKLSDLAKYLEGKAASIEGLGDVNFTTVKKAVVELFANAKIDIVEYKVPGEGEKNRVFCIPASSDVTYTETNEFLASAMPPSVLPEPVTEVQVDSVVPLELFAGYFILGNNSSEFTEHSYIAQATFMDMAAKNEDPRLFGAVPLKLEVTALLLTAESLPAVSIVTTSVTTVKPGVAPVTAASVDTPLGDNTPETPAQVIGSIEP